MSLNVKHQRKFQARKAGAQLNLVIINLSNSTTSLTAFNLACFNVHATHFYLCFVYYCETNFYYSLKTKKKLKMKGSVFILGCFGGGF
jgi:hypothetical protein